MSSSEKYQVHIRFNQNVYGMNLQLLNGDLDTVYEGVTNHVDLELPQGIYHLKISYLDYYQEKFFSIDSDTDLILDFNYPITIPVLGYSTTHEYYSRDAELYSHTCTSREQMAPDFFFFAALYDKDKPSAEHSREWLKHYRIFNIDNSTDIRFTEDNAVFDDEVGKVYFSVPLGPGLFFLSYENGEKDTRRIFPLYIFEGYQTQFFIRYAQQPDFKNSRFFFSQKRSFSETGVEYFILEKIICAFSEFKNFSLISDDEIGIIKEHPYLVSLVNILFNVVQEVHILQEENTGSSPVKDSAQLELPDIIYCKNNPDDIYVLSDKPPLLSLIFMRYAHQANEGNLIFKPASILDRTVDNLNHDLIWNNFSNIDEPKEWTSAYKPLLKSINQPSNPIIRSMTNVTNSVLNYISPRVDSNLDHLIGKTGLPEDEMNSFNTVIGKIGDLQEMSKEFGLPPTTILRNYRKYHDYYREMKEPHYATTEAKPTHGRRTIIITLMTVFALFIGAYLFWLTNDTENKKTQYVTIAEKGDKAKTDTFENNIAVLNNKETVQMVTVPGNPDNPPTLLNNDQPEVKKGSIAAVNPKAVIVAKNETKTKLKNKVTSKPSNDIAKAKLKDTISRYYNLVTLFNLSYSLYGKSKDGSYTYQAAKEQFSVNSRILELIKRDSAYLTPELTPSEISSVKEHFASWMKDFEANKLPAGDNEKLPKKLSLNNHSPFPLSLTKKLNTVFEQLKTRTENL